MSLPLISAALLLVAALAAPAVAAPDWNAVGAALGKTGSQQPDGIYKIALPRSDLHVTLDGVTLKPGFALGGWLGFEPVGEDAMMMGDLVLTPEEVDPVLAKLLEENIAVTAIHNHLLRTDPAVVYMHVEAHGDPAKLARGLHNAIAFSMTPLAAAQPPQGQASYLSAAALDPFPLDADALDRTIGFPGKNNGGILQYSLPRADKITAHGTPVPPALGTATAINFQPTGEGKAAITGDFVLTAQEVNPVAKALRQSGIAVTALHSHMLDEEPRLFFMHFWANDDARKLAQGLRAALDKVNLAKS